MGYRPSNSFYVDRAQKYSEQMLRMTSRKKPINMDLQENHIPKKHDRPDYYECEE